MIEILKKKSKEINLENLSYVNSWWDKDIVKNSKKINKRMIKFQKKDILDTLPKFSNKNPIDYNDFLKYANRTIELLYTKELQMEKDLRIIKKFKKMIMDFAFQSGLTSNLLAINKFYDITNNKEVENRKKLAIEIGNDFVLSIYEAYKKDYLKNIGEDEKIKNKIISTFEMDKIFDNKLFDPTPTVQVLFKFSKMSLNAKKISKEQFNKIIFNTLFVNYYLLEFEYLYGRFADQII